MDRAMIGRWIALLDQYLRGTSKLSIDPARNTGMTMVSAKDH